MKSIGRLMAKCAVAAAVVTGLFAATQFSERKAVATWAPNAKLESAKPAQAAAAPAAVTEQRLAAAERSCAAQVWPNISKDCITGRIEPERKEARAAASPQPQLAAVPAAPSVRSSTPDPASTGALPAAVPAPAVAPDLQATPAAPRTRDAQRPRNRPAPRAAAAQPAAPSRADRLREPVQFRLAEGRN
jgi:hypothetical protein